MANWLEREFLQGIGDVIGENGFLTAAASRLVIDSAVNVTRTRPHPWSTYADYPCWRGLTDRTYLARHLPPPAPDPAAPALPDINKVVALFARPATGARLSTKSTCLFPAFAQYLTDGFIRTNPIDPARTTSNHEIDLCPLYGRTPVQTTALRTNSEAAALRGKLKSHLLGDQEYPPFLYDADGNITDPAFIDLDPPLFDHGQKIKPPGAPFPAPPATWEVGRAQSLFAVGGDRVNSTPFTAMMNTLWLREHNRVATALVTGNPDWDDAHVFETARNIVIPMFIKIVVEEYINHITPLPFKLVADPSVAWNAGWNRPNWMTAEFSLLYRWHGLMPDSIEFPDGPIALALFTLDNRKLLETGLDEAFAAAAAQPTAELGALNTSAALIGIEQLSIMQSRANRLASYNAYRQAFGMQPATSFADISTNPAVQALLEQIYGTPDAVEFYPGLFAEDRVQDSALPGLLTRMVAVDAFSQALTNPLLSQHVWQDNAELAFTAWGFAEIAGTHSLNDILRRQGRPADAEELSMTQAGWTYAARP